MTNLILGTETVTTAALLDIFTDHDVEIAPIAAMILVKAMAFK